MRRAFPLLLLLSLGASGCQQPDPVEPQANQAQANQAAAEEPAQLLDRSQVGKPAPTDSFLKPDGSKASLADFRGKPVLLNLWATWCVPCITEMPHLDTLAGQHKDLQVLTVSQDTGEASKKKVDAFFAEKKFAHIEPYLDPDSALMSAFIVQSLPTTILFDKDGKEVWRLMGPEEWTGKKAAALIAEAS